MASTRGSSRRKFNNFGYSQRLWLFGTITVKNAFLVFSLLFAGQFSLLFSGLFSGLLAAAVPALCCAYRSS